MQRPRSPTTASLPRDRTFWMGISVLVVGQLIAFWTVCTQQVRMAQVRHSNEQVEMVAVRECLRATPNATPAACVKRVAPDSQRDVAASRSRAEPAVNSAHP